MELGLVIIAAGALLLIADRRNQELQSVVTEQRAAMDAAATDLEDAAEVMEALEALAGHWEHRALRNMNEFGDQDTAGTIMECVHDLRAVLDSPMKGDEDGRQ